MTTTDDDDDHTCNSQDSEGGDITGVLRGPSEGGGVVAEKCSLILNRKHQIYQF